MSYTVLGEAFHNKVLNEMLKEAHLAEIATMTCSNAMKERLRKADMTVSVKFVYPPYGEFQQQKKAGLGPSSGQSTRRPCA